MTRKSGGYGRPTSTASFNKNTKGMRQNIDEAFLDISTAVDVLNMHSLENGAWSSDQIGYSRVNPDAVAGGSPWGLPWMLYPVTDSGAYESGSQIDGIVDWVDENVNSHLIIAINGKLKEVNIATGLATDIDATAGFNPGSPVDFMALDNVLYSIDGTIDTPRTWDGTTAANSGGFPVNDGTNNYNRPLYVVSYQNRSVYLNFQNGTGGSTQYPSHIAISNLNNPETFTLPAVTAADGFIAEIASGDGQQIRGARTLFTPNTNDEQLVIFKDSSTYIMKGSSAKAGDTDVFHISKLDNSYGAINNRAIVTVKNMILALNIFGITAFSVSGDAGSVQPSAVSSDFVKDVIGRMNRNAKDNCWAIHLPDRRECWFFIPTGSSVLPNEAIVLKYPSDGEALTGETVKWSRREDTNGKFIATCGIMYGSTTFYIGKDDGIVGKMFDSSTYDDTGIPYKYEHAESDLGYPKTYKQVTGAEARFNTRTSASVNIRSRWLHPRVTDQTVPLSIGTGTGQALYGSAVYGTSRYSVSQTANIVRYQVRGDGVLLKTTVSGTTSDVGIEYLGIQVSFQVGSVLL